MLVIGRSTIDYGLSSKYKYNQCVTMSSIEISRRQEAFCCPWQPKQNLWQRGVGWSQFEPGIGLWAPLALR
jgi:hypothetical protein